MATLNNTVLAAAVVELIDPRDRVLPPEPVVLTGVFYQKNSNGHTSGFEQTHVPRVVRASELLPPLAYEAGDLQKKALHAKEMGAEKEQHKSQETSECTQPQSTLTGPDSHTPAKAGHEVECGFGDEAQGERSLLQRLKPWLAPIGLIALLYTFICSLEFLSSAFRLIAGKTAGARNLLTVRARFIADCLSLSLRARCTGRSFSESVQLNIPIVALMLGVMTTVLVQSSSTSTSIVVAMVFAGSVHTNSHSH